MGHKLSKALKIALAIETFVKNKHHKPQNHICDNDAAKGQNKVNIHNVLQSIKMFKNIEILKNIFENIDYLIICPAST